VAEVSQLGDSRAVSDLLRDLDATWGKRKEGAPVAALAPPTLAPATSSNNTWWVEGVPGTLLA
jgi:hypothetical protein